MKVYTMNDIRARYTQKVAELLAQGYQINPETMGGSQGEMAHIDFTNGTEVLRALIEERSSYGENYGDLLTIRVGKCTDELRGSHQIIWNNHLDTRFEITFDRLRKGCYTTAEDGKRCADKRFARYRQKHTSDATELGDAYKSVALRWLRRQPRMKSVKLEDITRMRRKHTRDGRVRYDIEARGKGYVLMAERFD